MNYLRLGLLGLLLLVLSYGAGYFFAPDKVKTVEKIVEVEKKVIEQHTKVVKEYDPSTGKLTKETDETGTKETNTETTKTDKETEKTKTSKTYAIKAGIAKVVSNTSKPFPRVGGEVRLPFFNSWLGAEGDITLSQPTVGAYLRLEF